MVCSDFNQGVDLADLRLVVKNYLDKSGKKEKRFVDNFPGDKWARTFYKQHKVLISQKISPNLKTASEICDSQLFHSNIVELNCKLG